MRSLILIAAAALCLWACKNNDATDNTQNIDENLTAENIVSNDVTAIDAVTGDAANMAADEDMNAVGASLSNTGNMAVTEKPAPKRPRTPAPSTTTPTANEASPVPTNSAE
jgi:cell division septation protein DedD